MDVWGTTIQPTTNIVQEGITIDANKRSYYQAKEDTLIREKSQIIQRMEKSFSASGIWFGFLTSHYNNDDSKHLYRCVSGIVLSVLLIQLN